ncbi:MAG: pirin family protein [Bdellovibrionales bacterium]|nr:pirin family protein [Bdellovibrionales bacterium]
MQIRKSEERGHMNYGWLNAKHSFSFGGYYDDLHLGYRDLRVINEDQVAAGEGFPMHPHKNMEILTYILDGKLEHKDSMGNHGIIGTGEVQYMSAGSGVTHSEFNGSDKELVHLLQIWILPEAQGGKPNYGQKNFKREGKLNQFQTIASRDGRDDSIQIRQDAAIYASILEANKTLSFKADSKRHYWVQVARGELKLGDTTLKQGDGVALDGASTLEFATASGSEFLLFDLN